MFVEWKVEEVLTMAVGFAASLGKQDQALDPQERLER